MATFNSNDDFDVDNVCICRCSYIARYMRSPLAYRFSMMRATFKFEVLLRSAGELENDGRQLVTGLLPFISVLVNCKSITRDE